MFNTIRTREAPSSLSRRQKYNSKDVLDELCKVFFKKCYICETKEPLDINVEHFSSHNGDLNKKFDWENLYLSCARCNNIKLQGYNNLLDCCDTNTDVLRAIKHKPPTTPYAKRLEIEPQLVDESTLATAELLNKVYNSDHTDTKMVTAVALRKEVFKQFNIFLELQCEYFDETSLEVEKENAIERMKLLIMPSSKYSAFISWCIIEDTVLYPILERNLST